MHNTASNIPPDAFKDNALDAKIVGCERALEAMSGSKQFQDDATCH
jgi:hypothetical protein